MIMKKYSLLMGLMIVSTIIFAQQNADAPARPGKHGDRLKKELALTDDQFNSVKSINKDFGARASELRKDSTLTKESKHQKGKDLRAEKDAALKKVMSEEQYSKFTDIRSARAKKSGHGRKHQSGDRALKMKKALSLSDEQTSEIKTLDKEYSEKFQKIRRDSTVSKEMKKTQARQLNDEHRVKTKSVLTDDQLQKWEAQRKARKNRKGK
jgi:protein CpxP